MPRPEKIEAVKQIAADLRAVDVYYFLDYRGLNINEAAELRARLVKTGTTLKVVKNSLARIAATEAGVEGLDDLIQGPTAIAYCDGDPIQAAKAIQDFIKEHKKAALRGGILDKSVVGASDLDKLATLPSRVQLMAQLVQAIASPLTGLVNVMNAPMRGLLVALAQVEEHKAAA